MILITNIFDILISMNFAIQLLKYLPFCGKITL